MKRRIMCRSQWNRQPDKADLFHDTFVDSWDATFFFIFFSLSHSPRNALLIIIYTRFVSSIHWECLSTGFSSSSSFGTDVLWRVYDPCRETLNAIREGCMCGCLVCCVLAPIGVWWMLFSVDCWEREKEKERGEALPRCVLIASTFRPSFAPSHCSAAFHSNVPVDNYGGHGRTRLERAGKTSHPVR